MEIDASAPAVARGEIEIAAPAELVWRVLTTIADWPSWNPDVKSASLDGPLVAGTGFRWKAGPGTIKSILRTVDPPHRIDWTGKTFGIKAVDVYEFEPRDGGTLVRTAESWDGLPVRLFRRRLTRTLQEATDSGLQHLKLEAERRAKAAFT